jgi:hypothetical protein
MLLKWLHVAGKASASNASIPQSVDFMELTTVVAAADPERQPIWFGRYRATRTESIGKSQKSRVYQIGITE